MITKAVFETPQYSLLMTMTKHMNRWRFLFLMLYLLDNHNEDVHQGANW